jgi:integrase
MAQLDIEKRHGANCTKRYREFQKDKWNCTCPFRITGTVNSQRIRQQTDITDSDRARKFADDLEKTLKGEATEEPVQPVSIANAVEAYLQDAKDRNLAPDTQRKLRTIFQTQLLQWSADRGYTVLKQVANVPAIRDFRASWKDAPLARSKKQDRIVGFFHFCHRSGFIPHQPITSRALGKILVDQQPTDYFTEGEFAKLIDATYIYRGDRWERGEKTDQFGARLRAIVLLMRWTGLRVRDAYTLEKDRLCKTERGQDAILLYQAKTGEPVYCVIPPDSVEALRTLPPGNESNPKYFFWSGNGLPKSAVADFQRSFRKLVKLAGITKRSHPHMLRDTFAVECLLAGVPLEKVSMLLGHKSVKITEKHYKPFVKAMRWDLEDEVTKTWGPAKLSVVPNRRLA